MSAVNIPEAKKSLAPEQVTVRNLLMENGQLIETAAEYQRMGRIEESLRYQELLHKNLIYLARLADRSYSSQILNEISTAAAQQAQQQTVGGNSPPISSATAAATPMQQPVQQLTNGNPLSHPSSRPGSNSSRLQQSPNNGEAQQPTQLAIPIPVSTQQQQIPSPASQPPLQQTSPQQRSTQQQNSSIITSQQAQRNLPQSFPVSAMHYPQYDNSTTGMGISPAQLVQPQAYPGHQMYVQGYPIVPAAQQNDSARSS